MKQSILLISAFFLVNSIFSQHLEKIEDNRFIKINNKKYGVTDSFGNAIVPFIYDFIDYKNDRLIVRRHGLEGVITLNNKEIVPIRYQYVLPRGNNRFILWTPDSVDGLCDADGKIILPEKYKSISSTEEDDYYITENGAGLNGVYDFNGNNIIPELYKFYTVDNYKIFAVKDQQPLILDIQNPDHKVYLDKDITLIETRRHLAMGEQFYQIIKKENKYGVINASNQIIIPVIYDLIRSSDNWRHFVIGKNNKFGLIHVNGQIVKEPVYDAIELRKEHVLLKRKNQKNEIYSYKW